MHKIKENFATGAIVLAVGGIICKVLGAVYRIPLTNALGAEGIGLYQLVYAVYAVFIVLSSGGITPAVSRLVAEDLAVGLSGRRHVKVGVIVSALASLIAAIMLLILNGNIAKLQGNADSSLGYMIIAPSVFFVGLSSVMKGYFQGRLNMFPTTISNLVEQIVKIGLGLGLAFYLFKTDVLYALYGTLLAVTVSEFLSCVYLVVSFLIDRRKTRKQLSANSLRTDERYKNGELKKFLTTALPFAFLAIALPMSSFIDSFMIVNLLKRGMTVQMATANYGVFSGQVTTLVNMPIMVLLSLAVAIVPSVSKGRAERDLDGVLLKTKLSIKLCLLIGAPIALFMLVFSREIMAILYPRLDSAALGLGSSLLVIMSPSIVTMSLAEVLGAINSALDKTYYSALSMLLGVAVKTLIVLTTTFKLGIMAAAIGNLALSVVALMINGLILTRQIGYRRETIKGIGLIMLGSVFIALISLLNKMIFVNIYLQLALSVVVGGMTYFFIVTALDVFTVDETNSLPMSKFLLKTRSRLRFWDGEA